MINNNVIKASYTAMTDGELINFAIEDGTGLTREAFLLLKQEFIFRKLDIHVLNRIEDGTFSENQQAVKDIENTVVKEFSTTVLAHALNEKRDGKMDEEIIAGLTDNGMNENDAVTLISQLERHALLLKSKASTSLLTAIFICMAGIAFYMIIPSKPVVTIMDILAICAIAFGIMKFLKSLFDKNKYETVIRNIKSS